jgi:hypothetical protein
MISARPQINTQSDRLIPNLFRTNPNNFHTKPTVQSRLQAGLCYNRKKQLGLDRLKAIFMNKAEFVEKAPLYYAAMIAWVIQHDQIAGNGALSITQMNMIIDPNSTGLLINEPLITKAVQFLQDEDAITVHNDPFGPSLIFANLGFDIWWNQNGPNKYPLIRTIRRTSDAKNWLKLALSEVNREYNRLGIEPEDFEASASEIEWEPIPLDRNEPSLQLTIDAVDETIKAVEADNGYAVHAPAEREYVTFNLAHVSKLLKEETQITWMQLKTFAIEPLQRIIQRFGPNALGLLATAAKAALHDWLKKNITHIIDFLWPT